jgi:hypothetical protein
MSQATWSYSEPFVYDGTAKSVSLTNLPQGVTVKSYVDNSKTDAGEYTASASFNYDTTNYNSPSVSNCSWIIDKATISGVTVEENQSIPHDGEYHLPEISGNIPDGVTVEYAIDGTPTTSGASALGTYNYSITLSGKNYKTLTLNCTLQIKLNLKNLANTVFKALGDVPDAWEFLPSSFASTNREIKAIPDYSTFVNVSSIPTNGIGKQLNVAYGLLNKMEKAISFVQPVYSVMNTIKNLYTDFIDKNPEDYQSYSGTVAGITFSMSVGETSYLLSATVSSVSIVIYADTATTSYGARIQLTDTTVLKYTVSENSLIIAMDILDTVATQIEFVRDTKTDKVLGYMYEFMTLADKQLRATSTLIEVGTTYTTLIGTKGDFIPTADSRNCEIYLNSTGELVGTEVREKLNIKGLGEAIYNTLWYTLNDINGITNIKKVDEANGLNADTIYINNATKAIHSKTVSLLPTSAKAYSRRFDIEFKTMYFYQYDQAKEEYVEVSCKIPMIFVQEENASTFIDDFSDENKDYLSGNISLNVSSADKLAVNYGYYTLLDAYDLIKELVTFDMVSNYCKQ